MSELVVTSVRTGAELDRVNLVDGRLAYVTGFAQGLFESLRASNPRLTDERMFELRADWSNGYVAIAVSDAGGDSGSTVAAAAGRDPTADEAASGADFAAHQEAWQSAFTDLQAEWPDAAQPMVDDLSQQAGDDVANDKLADLAGLAVSAAVVAALAAVLAAAMLRLAAKAAAHVVTEAASQGQTITASGQPGADRVDEVAQVVAGLIVNGYATAAARKAMQVASGTATAADVATAVSETLTAMSNAPTGWVADNLRAALSAAQNVGRAAVFEAHPPAALIASEIHDENQCVPCGDIDGKRFGSLAEADAAYPVHGYVNCLGGDRCRGMVLGLWR